MAHGAPVRTLVLLGALVACAQARRPSKAEHDPDRGGPAPVVGQSSQKECREDDECARRCSAGPAAWGMLTRAWLRAARCSYVEECYNGRCLLMMGQGTSHHAGVVYTQMLGGEMWTEEQFFGVHLACLVVLMLVITFWEMLVVPTAVGQVMPTAALSLTLGMAFGCLIKVVHLQEAEEHVMSFSNRLFLFVLLPPIIYESAFMMDRKTFFHNCGTILFIVIPGVLMSTAIIGVVTYSAGAAGWFTHSEKAPLDFSSPLDSFMFGSLISATDPVATLAILSTVNISPVLFALIFGEAMLNDATSIVIYKVLKWYGDDAFTLKAVPVVALDFLAIAIGSVLVGAGLGLLSSHIHKRVMRRTTHNPSGEMTSLILFGYLAYVVAEAFNLSGITALLVAGIVQRYYAFYSISSEAQHACHHVLKLIASKSEQFVFLYLGINVFLVSGDSDLTSAIVRRQWGLDLIAFCAFEIAVVMLSRLIMVISLCSLANIRRRNHPVRMREMMLMWWAGLRGAMAFVRLLPRPPAPTLRAFSFPGTLPPHPPAAAGPGQGFG